MTDLVKAVSVPIKPTDFVFERMPGSGEPLPPSRISQAWQRLCKELGVNARLHDLRHLQASLLLEAGEAITTVAARLGHRDTATTLKVYGHLMPGADARAAGIVGSAQPPGEEGEMTVGWSPGGPRCTATTSCGDRSRPVCSRLRE